MERHLPKDHRGTVYTPEGTNTTSPLDRIIDKAREITTQYRGVDVVDDYAFICAITYETDFSDLLKQSGTTDTAELLRLTIYDRISGETQKPLGNPHGFTQTVDRAQRAAQLLAGEGEEITPRHLIEGMASIQEGPGSFLFATLLDRAKRNK